MESTNTKDVKANNGQEMNDFRKAISTYDYPQCPLLNSNLRNDPKVSIISNLFPIEYIDSIHTIALYSIEYLPTISDENYPLKRILHQHLETLLPEEFKKTFFAGNNLYACVTNFNNKNLSSFEFSTSISQVEYKIKINKAKEINFQEINNNDDKEIQQIKHIIEKLIRFIIMRNPKVIKFQDGTIVNLQQRSNVQPLGENTDQGNAESIYKGYMTSVHITNNGLFMRINDVNKIISTKSVYKKIVEIKNNNNDKGHIEVRELINDYFRTHRTVLTRYGNFRTYRLSAINFDKTPKNTCIKIKDINGKVNNVSLSNYFYNQYGVKIKDENQPLIEVEKKTKSGENSDVEIIYLVPELVSLTGLEDSSAATDNTKRKITNKTKMKPGDKIKAINGINELLNSTVNKKHKNKEGKEIVLKSAKEVKDMYGINIGNNLTIKGRIIPQPHLIFNKGQKFIVPNNGNFKSDNPNKVIMFTNDNLFYVYDIKEKNDCINLFNNIMNKCRMKKFIFADNFNPRNIKGYALQRTNGWEEINNSLKKAIPENSPHKFGFVFLSRNMERYYSQLKNFFINRMNFITQFGITKKLVDPKRGNTIQFNLLEQFNIKIGGESHYINFIKENVMKDNDVYLVIGLKSQVDRKTNKIKYCMTATKNRFLNCIDTSVKECDNNKMERSKLLHSMFKSAIKNLMDSSKRNPNFILFYRKGGNYLENLKIAIDEKEVLINVIKDLENMLKNKENKNVKIPFYYLCCNLKCDLKFFEYTDNIGNKVYTNPKSGLVIDENVTQKNKFEFFIQPQFVNQGTATPCHYQVMCTYNHSEDIIKLEQLEKITFYLCYYYFTWSGAIREPGTLKMAETALDFSSKCLNENNSLNYFFTTPIYV